MHKIKQLVPHLLNCLFLAGVSYVLYQHFRQEAILNCNDIYIKRDLVYAYYWIFVIIVLLQYQLYFFLFKVIFNSVTMVRKSMIFGILCIIILWLLLSLYHTFNFIDLIKDIRRFVPFISIAPIGFLLPLSAEFFKKLLWPSGHNLKKINGDMLKTNLP